MSKYGIKISRPGYDVDSATDDNLIYSSEFNTPKIFRRIKFTSSGSQAHGLTYPPDFDYYVKNTTSGRTRRGQNYYFGWPATVQVDSTNVYATVSSGVEIYVTLFTNPLNE